MKKLVGILLVAVLFASCQTQKKQWFSTSPEIDLVKKLDASFAGSDWATFRSSFADTAKIWVNVPWSEPGISADTLTARFTASRAGMTALKLSNEVYEMIETDDGDRWVHRWGLWEGTLANGKSASWTSNANFLVSDGKIRIAAYIFNGLPTYLANQPDPLPAAPK